MQIGVGLRPGIAFTALTDIPLEAGFSSIGRRNASAAEGLPSQGSGFQGF